MLILRFVWFYLSDGNPLLYEEQYVVLKHFIENSLDIHKVNYYSCFFPSWLSVWRILLLIIIVQVVLVLLSVDWTSLTMISRDSATRNWHFPANRNFILTLWIPKFTILKPKIFAQISLAHDFFWSFRLYPLVQIPVKIRLNTW